MTISCDGRGEAFLANRHDVGADRQGVRFEASIAVRGELLDVI